MRGRREFAKSVLTRCHGSFYQVAESLQELCAVELFRPVADEVRIEGLLMLLELEDRSADRRLRLLAEVNPCAEGRLSLRTGSLDRLECAPFAIGDHRFA